ncbi:DUF72 domain-containing protein [Kibdelosporangium philippinense]|uniref:DUF72 domain-containing protein n=1 Tax=Kibdelosporangium philippinense TaxID=211113 RepID=A0ABS8ZQ37_9PSEU|nr:DUF72 domain-containing protein [Kibdelosporangium philippinense]MCE7009697.1 DUF72 domain-containing protein [Kibdelosporangium philippinense]
MGTSGWLYPPWRGVFYPKGLPHRRELEYISRQVDSVEINGSFYSLQRPTSYQRWSAETPDDFVFAVKGGRFITHMKRLKDVETPLANFFASGVLALEHKLGPVLWQFPASFPFDEGLFSQFFALLPRSTYSAASLAEGHDSRLDGRSWTEVSDDRPIRHAVEVRHPSFADPSFAKLLRGNDIAMVVADTAGKFPYFDDVTTDFVYIRLHGDVELYASGYSDEALDLWANRIRQWNTDTYVYFDNDIKVKAPGDAIALRKRLPNTR